MSGIMQNIVGGSFATFVPVIGSALGGGFFAGQISTAGNGIADYNIIIGPLASAQNNNKQYKNANTAVVGADSVIDGPQNTADMVGSGNATVYPAAHFCNDLVIGGFSDWYMPAKNELEVCYFNLKPTTTVNNTTTGANTNAVPSRGSNYTSGTPAQTSAADFVTGTGTESFGTLTYWTSTENTNPSAWTQIFGYGLQYAYGKVGVNSVRAVRRVAV